MPIKLSHVCNQTFLDHSCYVHECPMSIRFIKASAQYELKIINNLSDEKSPEYDGIRAMDIKFVKEQFSPILAKFMNLSVNNGIYPKVHKIANIRPLY